MTLGPDRITRLRWLEADKGAGSGGTGKEAADASADDDAGDDDDDDGADDDAATDDAAKPKGKAAADDAEDDEPKFKAIQSEDELAAWKAATRKKLRSEARKELEAEARRKALEEQGDFKALYEAEKEKSEKAARELAETQLKALKQSIGKKHNLPDKLIDRLAGTTEKEIEADAKTLAEELSVSKPPPDTESGRSSRKSGSNAGSKPTRPFAFQREGDVTWNRQPAERN